MQKNWGWTSLNEAKPESQKVVLISNSLSEKFQVLLMNYSNILVMVVIDIV